MTCMGLSDRIFVMVVADHLIFHNSYKAKDVNGRIDATCNHKRIFVIVQLKEAHLEGSP